MQSPQTHGFYITGNDNTVEALIVGNAGTDDTHDMVHLTGTAARNSIRCKLRPPTSGNAHQYGVYCGASTVDNQIVGTDFGVVADYGTDAFLDDGANIIDWPADATYGDNFTL